MTKKSDTARVYFEVTTDKREKQSRKRAEFRGSRPDSPALIVFPVLRPDASPGQLTAVETAETGRVAAAAFCGRFRIRHGIPPELLAQQRERRQLLSVLRLPHRPRQRQLHRQLITACRRQKQTGRFKLPNSES